MLLALRSLNLSAPFKQTGECLLLTELILPRNGIARKASLKDIHLSKGKRSFARAPFYEKALFKEKVDGRYGLKVSLTRPLTNPELHQFFRQMLATGIAGLGDAAALLAVPSLSISAFARGGRELASLPFDALSDDLSEKSPNFIATGGLDLDSEAVSREAITISLKLTETFRSSQNVRLADKREKRKQLSKTYRKGTVIGEIILDLSHQ